MDRLTTGSFEVDYSSINDGRKEFTGDNDSCSTLYDYDSDLGEISDSASTTSQMDSGRESLVYSTESWTVNSFMLKGEEDGVSYLLQGEEKKAYLTAREIASSERSFVDCLHLICIDFRTAVLKASRKSSSIIPEADLNKILSYLPHLQNLNQELLNDFEERVNNWLQQPKIADVFLRKGPFLKLYSAYIHGFENQSALLDECVQKYPQFAKTLHQFEMSDRCRGLSLKHHIIKPVQRLPQYRLLLEVYLRHLSESSSDYKDAVAALKIVSDVAEHANSSMKQEDNFQTLLRLQSRLGNWDIIKPGRYIVKEGDLAKVSRKMIQPRYFILFNDALLYTSYLSFPSPTSNLKLHQELPLARMEIRLPELTTGRERRSEFNFNVISTIRSFTLSAKSAQIRDEWVMALIETISHFQSKRSSYQQQPTADSYETESYLGQQAPVWIPDRRAKKCQVCNTHFTVVFRRHHCRACGKVICRNCSSNKAELEYLKFQSARVCDECFRTIRVSAKKLPVAQQLSTEETESNRNSIDEGRFSFEDPKNSSTKSRTGSAKGRFLRRRGALRKTEKRQNSIESLINAAVLAGNVASVVVKDPEPRMSGYLSRRSNGIWVKNWYVLKDMVLYIYHIPDESDPLDVLPVLGCFVVSVDKGSEEERRNVFQLRHPNKSPIFFRADKASLAHEWIRAFESDLASSTAL